MVKSHQLFPMPLPHDSSAARISLLPLGQRSVNTGATTNLGAQGMMQDWLTECF
jgi:hypothetical protein